jgi:uncharacterized membrane protein YqgA involved in biofilm formation
MWLLSWLPNWIFYAILFAGIIGLILSKFIPSAYKLPTQAASAIALVIGVFMAGAIHDNETWLAKVRELEAKLIQAEAKSAVETVRIETKVEKQKQKIVEKQVVVKQYIDREVVKYDNQCVIPKEFINAHNQAAENDKK